MRRRRAGDGDDRRAASLIEALRAAAHEVATEWGLELEEPFGLSRHSFVAPNGEGAVLKVTPPEDDESDQEGDALELWAGGGAVRLLDRDQRRRALLLERALPGTDLSELPEDEATAIAVEVGRRLWRPATAPFRWIGDHVPRWLAEQPNDLTALALELYGSLDVGRTTLVHGDFQHHNVLASARGYLAIDPKPMLGEPEYDVPPFLWNPISYRMRFDVTERRLAAFAAAGLDEERMRKWAIIRGAYLRADAEESRMLGVLLS